MKQKSKFSSTIINYLNITEQHKKTKLKAKLTKIKIYLKLYIYSKKLKMNRSGNFQKEILLRNQPKKEKKKE